MAFTRSDLGQTNSFTRSGASTFVSTPNFQVFQVADGPTSFSLSNNWVLTTQAGTSPTLNFKYSGNSILELTSTGVANLTLPSLKLNNNSQLPSTAQYSAGDMVKKQGDLFVLYDTEGQVNPT